MHLEDSSIWYCVATNGSEGLQMLAAGNKEFSSLYEGNPLIQFVSEISATYRIDHLLISVCFPALQAVYFTFGFKRGEGREHKPIGTHEKQQILDQLYATAESEIKKIVAERSGLLAKDILINRFGVSKVEINGYTVLDIMGCAGSMVSFVVWAETITQQIVQWLSKLSLIKGAPRMEAAHIAHGFESFSARSGGNEAYLFVGAEKSQLMYLENGVLLRTAIIEQGGKQFTSTLMDSMQMHENTALELQERYFQGKVSDDLRVRIRKLMLPCASRIASSVQQGMMRFDMQTAERLWICGPYSLGLELQEMLEETFPDMDIAFLYPKNVKFTKLKKVIQSADPRFTPILLLAIWHYEHNKKSY